MEGYVPGSQIVQAAMGSGTTGPELIYSATQQTEITRVLACNTTATTATFRLFHSDGGTTYTTTTAIYYDQDVKPKSTFDVSAPFKGSGITISRGGTLGAQSNLTANITLSIYGITQQSR